MEGTQSKTMAEWLREEFARRTEERGRTFGAHSLARLMAPSNPGNVRRLIGKWLTGTHPNEESIQRVADALGIPREEIPVRGDGHRPPFPERSQMIDDLIEELRELRDRVAA